MTMEAGGILVTLGGEVNEALEVCLDAVIYDSRPTHRAFVRANCDSNARLELRCASPVLELPRPICYSPTRLPSREPLYRVVKE